VACSDYWRIRHEDRVLHVHLCPPGDLPQLDMHYPGCTHHVAMKREAWMDEIGRQQREVPTVQQATDDRRVPRRPPYVDLVTLNAHADRMRGVERRRG
jgi:hypothetical protein